VSQREISQATPPASEPENESADTIEARRGRIREYLSNRESATTHQIATHVGISAITIRRDLQLLQEQGVVDRFHGGARLTPPRPEAEENFSARQRRSASDKVRIGALAATLVRPGDSLVMNDGTTVMQAALAIRDSGRECSVATNALNVALALSDGDKLSVNALGGLVRRVSYGTYSPSEDFLSGMKFDLVILGAEALDVDEGVYLDNDFDIVTARRMIARSERVAVIADGSKWLRRGRRLMATWKEVDVLVTSSCPPATQAALEKLAVEVMVA
jgi:DeoR family transcriptional regulator of aga operon